MPDMVKQHTERDPFWGLVRVAVRATGKPLTKLHGANGVGRMAHSLVPSLLQAPRTSKNYNAVLAAVASIQLVLSCMISG